MNEHTEYIITRTRDSTEWSMAEHDEDHPRKDIYRSVDDTPMRPVIIFKAPSWEDAKRVYDWALDHLHRRHIKERMSWLEVEVLLGK